MTPPTASTPPVTVDGPRTVVGYLRADTHPAAARLARALRHHAQGTGFLTVSTVHRDPVTGDGARRPGFARCLRDLATGTVHGVLVPTWEHLAENALLARALLRQVHAAGGRLYVLDPLPATRPPWTAHRPTAAPRLSPTTTDDNARTPAPNPKNFHLLLEPGPIWSIHPA